MLDCELCTIGVFDNLIEGWWEVGYELIVDERMDDGFCKVRMREVEGNRENSVLFGRVGKKGSIGKEKRLWEWDVLLDHLRINNKNTVDILSMRKYNYHKLFQAVHIAFDMYLPVVLYCSNHSCFSIYSKFGLLFGFLSKIFFINPINFSVK